MPNFAHLEPLVQVGRHGHDISGSLHDVDCPTGEPGPLKLRKKVFPDNERAHTRWEAEHLVEANGHGVNRRVGQREDGCWRERRGIEQGVIAL